MEHKNKKFFKDRNLVGTVTAVCSSRMKSHNYRIKRLFKGIPLKRRLILIIL